MPSWSAFLLIGMLCHGGDVQYTHLQMTSQYRLTQLHFQMLYSYLVVIDLPITQPQPLTKLKRDNWARCATSTNIAQFTWN